MNGNRVFTSIAALAMIAGLGAGPVWAGEDDESLPDSMATISRDDAARTALARVPGGTLHDWELEREHGKLVWSFEINDPESGKIAEVLVDARTGEFVSEEFESSPD